MAKIADDKLTPGNARVLTQGGVLRDDVVRGLELHGGKTRRTFRFYYRTRQGVRRRPRLGCWPDMNIDDARRAARDLQMRVAAGDDPSGEWADARNAPTVADLWEHYLPWLERNRAPGTVREYTRQVASSLLPHELAAKRVRDVTLIDVEAWLRDVRARRMVTVGTKKDGRALLHTPSKKEAPKAANRAHALLSGMFRHAELRTVTATAPAWRPRGTNPCAGAELAPNGKRERYATPEELAAIGALLRELLPAYPFHVSLLILHLLTGARTSELGSASWRDLNAAKTELTVEDHKTARRTGKKVLIIPGKAREILEHLSARPIDSTGKIFQGLATDAPLRFLWEKVRASANCPDLQIRDLRRTYASLIYDPSSGEAVNERIIGGLLGHTNPETTRIYTHLFGQVKQKAAETAANQGAKMLGFSGRRDDDNNGG